MARRSNEGYPLRIPYNIDLDNLLLAFPIDNVPNAKEYLLYIISLIWVNDPNSTQHNFTFLFSKYLQKIVDNYKPLLLWLYERRIIEIDWIYVIGEKSRGYRFANAYNAPYKEEFVYKPTLIKRLTEIEPQLRSRISYVAEIREFTLNDGVSYRFTDNWIGYKSIAGILNLSALKMKIGLRKYKLVKEPDDQNGHNVERTVDSFYYYKVLRYGDGDDLRISYHLMLNIEKIEVIRRLALKYPSEFKTKKVLRSNLLTYILLSL